MLDAIRSRLLFQNPFVGAASHPPPPPPPPPHPLALCQICKIRVASFWEEKRGGDVEEIERKESLFFFLAAQGGEREDGNSAKRHN